MPGDISFAWTICDLMSSHALKPQRQGSCTQASETILPQMLRICFANFSYSYLFSTIDQRLKLWTNCCLINKRVAWDMNNLLGIWLPTSSKSGRWRGLLATLPKHPSAGDLHRKCPNSTNGAASSNSTSRSDEPQNESHSWLWIQNTFTCWVCLNLIDANTLSDATLESDCFKDEGLSIKRRLL